jgi:hypothetical protein
MSKTTRHAEEEFASAAALFSPDEMTRIRQRAEEIAREAGFRAGDLEQNGLQWVGQYHAMRAVIEARCEATSRMWQTGRYE